MDTVVNVFRKSYKLTVDIPVAMGTRRKRSHPLVYATWLHEPEYFLPLGYGHSSEICKKKRAYTPIWTWHSTIHSKFLLLTLCQHIATPDWSLAVVTALLLQLREALKSLLASQKTLLRRVCWVRGVFRVAQQALFQYEQLKEDYEAMRHYFSALQYAAHAKTAGQPRRDASRTAAS